MRIQRTSDTRGQSYNVHQLTHGQLLGLMEESINRSLINFYGAMEAATDYASRSQLQEIIKQAEELRSEINRVFGEDRA